MRRWTGWVAILFAAVIGCSGAVAHPAVRCAAQLQVNSKGQGSLTLRFDVLCFVLNEQPIQASDDAIWAFVEGPSSEIDKALEAAAGRLQRHVVLRADGREIETVPRAFPAGAEFERWKQDVRKPGDRPRLPWMADATLSFELPPESRGLDVRFPEVLGDLVLAFEVFGSEASAIPLRAGEQSPEISLRVSDVGFDKAETRGDQESKRGFAAFVWMGAQHIVPQGLDHMLFILGLFLASPRVKSLLVMVTMFTLAHSVTLALAATGLVVVPPRFIEPVIALSIAAVAIENIFSSRASIQTQAHPPILAPIGEVASEKCRTLPPTPSLREGASELRVRAAIVFAFGLVHGLGFASAFREMELPRSLLVPALVGFNVGVEVAQLLVLTCAFVLIGWAGKKNWYRGVIVVPGSVVIACVGLYWAVTRVMSG